MTSDIRYIKPIKGKKNMYLQVMLLHLCHLYNSTSVTPARNVRHNLLFLPARLCVLLFMTNDGERCCSKMK